MGAVRTLCALALGMCAWASLARAQDTTTGLLVRYRLENDALDVASGKDGSATSITYAAGHVGQAAVFNGTSSRIDMPASAGFLPSGAEDRTLAFWMKPATVPSASSRHVAAWGSASSGQLFGPMIQATTGHVVLVTTGSDVDTGYVPASNTWVHVAFTYASGTLTTYVNGAAVSTVSGLTLATDASQNLRLGMRDSASAVNPFHGSLDEVRVYDRALSAADVTQLVAGTAELHVTPSSYAFGSVSVGSTASTLFTLSNLGTSSLSVSGVLGSGDVAASAALGSCGSLAPVLAAGASCTLGAVFSPQAPGAQSSALRIVSNDPSSPLRVNVSGTGLGATLVVSADDVSFHGVESGTVSNPTSLTLTNTGNVPLVVSSLGLGDTHFSVTPGSCASVTPTLLPGESCALSIVFTPDAVGAWSGALTIGSNVAPQVVSLQGFTAAPVPLLSPWGFVMFAAALLALSLRGRRSAM